KVLMVSGRAGAEIVQKAATAGIPVVAAVSAPTTLAVDLAAGWGMTLAGFIRDKQCNVYSGVERVRDETGTTAPSSTPQPEGPYSERS
ncbi:MAG TPA: formate dehydrogenase accessory sulfurtransferase FdhD, partial [Stackebrandtia sp.]|uniref:formate dehydrogenase accessory sulfurtransferase FdhD n=1 Tax=Stackebrandtia sp. TaxID=2023065 RepID=UPI002D442A96